MENKETESQNQEEQMQQDQDVVQSAEQDTVSDSQETTSETTEDVADPVLQLEQKNKELEEKVAELQDQYLRKVADFDNYRKRMIKEKQDAFDYANTSLLTDLLESLDNFDRALESASTASDLTGLIEGVQMTKDKLISMLENKYSLTSYGAKGDAFDPNIHEAIASVPGPVADPVCSEVYLKGYKLKDRIIRYAKVMVQMPDGSVAAEDGKKTEPADE